jgi:N-carbamoylputrescine amidase
MSSKLQMLVMSGSVKDARKEITLSLVQMHVDGDNKQSNLSTAELSIDEAVAKHGAELIVLPELFTTSYFAVSMDRKYFDLAEPIPGPSIERIAMKAQQHKVHIIAPIFEKVEPGQYYDSSPLISPQGRVIAVHRKVHREDTWIPESGIGDYEKFYFRGGSQLDVSSMGKCRVGQLICYDRHFPEAWRTLALKGADLVVVPGATLGKLLSDMYVLEGRAMAFMNQVFAAVLNRVGSQAEWSFFGSSYIAGPDGRLMAGPASSTEPEILSATLKLRELDDMRREFQLYRDRRTDLYESVSHSLPLP